MARREQRQPSHVLDAPAQQLEAEMVGGLEQGDVLLGLGVERDRPAGVVVGDGGVAQRHQVKQVGPHGRGTRGWGTLAPTRNSCPDFNGGTKKTAKKSLRTLHRLSHGCGHGLANLRGQGGMKTHPALHTNTNTAALCMSTVMSSAVTQLTLNARS